MPTYPPCWVFKAQQKPKTNKTKKNEEKQTQQN